MRILFLVLSPGICLAQAPHTRVNIQLLGPEQGLPSRNIRCLAQDGRGFMWVGTGQDLWRYDGYHFQNFTETLTRSIGSRTLINQVRPGPDGNIWVAHNKGVSIVDAVSLRCRTIDASQYFKEIGSRQNLDIFFDQKQNAWVAFPRGQLVRIGQDHIPASRYVPGTAGSGLSVESVVTALFSDRQNRLYAFVKNGFLEMLDENGSASRRIDLLAQLAPGHYKVISALQASPDTLTVYYQQKEGGKKMRKYTFKEQTFSSITNADTPFVPDLLYRGSKGYTWYKSEKEIGFLNRKTGTFTALTTRLQHKSGANVFFFTAYLSTDDGLWISGVDGLFKISLTGEIFSKYLSVPLENPGDIGSSIRGITEDDAGRIWACSYGFNVNGKTHLLHRIDPKNGTVKHLELRRPKDMPGDQVIPYKLIFNKDRIFAITDGVQFLQIDPATLVYRPVEFPFVSGRGFTSLFQLDAHTFWTGTWGGMGIIDSRKLAPVLLNDKPGKYIKNERVNHFLPWPGNRVLVSTTNGLYLLNSDATIQAHFGQAPGDRIKLPALQIFQATWHDGALWAGSGQGLIRIDTLRRQTRIFTAQDGLPDNNIYAALPDERGNLWLSTNKGLSRLNTRTQQFQNFGLLDGLPHLEFNHGSYLKSKDGTLYFGGLNGIVAFNPAQIDMTPQQQRTLQLIAFSKHDADRNRTDTIAGHQSGEKIVFQPGDRLFAFSFMSPDYENTALNRFRYKLEGWGDDQWHMFENGNKLMLNSLPPGLYKLRVQVSVAGTGWSASEWQAPIEVMAPWYRSFWFMALSILAIGSVIYLFYRYRLRQVLHIQQIRNGISADMHDEIGSTLSSITFYSQALLMQMDKTEHQQVVQKIKDNAQQVQEGLSDIVWSVKAGRDEIEDVFARMFHFGSGLAESRGIVFHFETDALLRNMKLDMQTRKNLYLIFKEAVNNAAKYADCTALWVNVGYENSRVCMVIRDNGKGFDCDRARQGNGLNNMRQRAAQIRGKLSIRSGQDDGTTITLVF